MASNNSSKNRTDRWHIADQPNRRREIESDSIYVEWVLKMTFGAEKLTFCLQLGSPTHTSQKNMSNCQKWLLTTACFVHIWGNKAANYTGMDGIRILLKRHSDWDGRWIRFLMNYASFHFRLYTSPVLTLTVEILDPWWIKSAPFVISSYLIHKLLLEGTCLPYQCKWAAVLEGLRCTAVPFLCNQFLMVSNEIINTFNKYPYHKKQNVLENSSIIMLSVLTWSKKPISKVDKIQKRSRIMKIIKALMVKWGYQRKGNYCN